MQQRERALQDRQRRVHQDLLPGVHFSQDVDRLLGIVERPFERLANGPRHLPHRLRILLEIVRTGDERDAGNRHAVVGIVESLHTDACRFDDRHGLEAEGDDRIAPPGDDRGVLRCRVRTDDVHLLDIDAGRSHESGQQRGRRVAVGDDQRLAFNVLGLRDAALEVVDNADRIALIETHDRFDRQALCYQLHHGAAVDGGELAVPVADRLRHIGRTIAGLDGDVEPFSLVVAVLDADEVRRMVAADDPVQAQGDLLRILSKRVRRAARDRQNGSESQCNRETRTTNR